MWPFKCKECPQLKQLADTWHIRCGEQMARAIKAESKAVLSELEWHPLSELPPINTNLLVANKDFTYFGFLYMEDGWDYSRKINMQSKNNVWATYTNPESISYWLNLDAIKKG